MNGGPSPTRANKRCPEYRGGRERPGACPLAPKKERKRETQVDGGAPCRGVRPKPQRKEERKQVKERKKVSKYTSK